MEAQQQRSKGAGSRFREALRQEQALQVVGAITACAARMAEATEFKALYLSGGGVAANSGRKLLMCNHLRPMMWILYSRHH